MKKIKEMFRRKTDGAAIPHASTNHKSTKPTGVNTKEFAQAVVEEYGETLVLLSKE